MFRSIFCTLALLTSLALTQAASATVWSVPTAVFQARVVPAEGKVYFNVPAPLLSDFPAWNCGDNGRFALDLTVPGHAEFYALILTAVTRQRTIVLEFVNDTDCAGTPGTAPVPYALWIF